MIYLSKSNSNEASQDEQMNEEDGMSKSILSDDEEKKSLINIKKRAFDRGARDNKI